MGILETLYRCGLSGDLRDAYARLLDREFRIGRRTLQEHMRRTSIRELPIHTSELVREAAEGSVIVIERRGEPVAELRPLSVPARMPADQKARIFDSMREVWARMPQIGDSTKIFEEDRGR